MSPHPPTRQWQTSTFLEYPTKCAYIPHIITVGGVINNGNWCIFCWPLLFVRKRLIVLKNAKGHWPANWKHSVSNPKVWFCPCCEWFPFRGPSHLWYFHRNSYSMEIMFALTHILVKWLLESGDRLIFNMGIPIPGKTVFILIRGPGVHEWNYNDMISLP